MKNEEIIAEESVETSSAEPKKTITVSVELTTEQNTFLKGWQKTHQEELGMEIPIGALVRKAVENAMKFQRSRDDKPAFERKTGDRPSFGSRPPFGGGRPSGGRPSFGDRPSGGRPSFGDRPDRGGRPSFGARPSFGDRPSRGPKFDMMGTGHKTKSFGDK